MRVRLILCSISQLSRDSQRIQMMRSFVVISILLCIAIVARAGNIIFEEKFDTFDRNTWTHLITGWRGGNKEFQYYTDRPENRYHYLTIL